MVNNLLFRDYLFKFYLNASHYVIINGTKGPVHSHTWEFSLTIAVTVDNFKQFNVFEKAISEYVKPYQNTVLNNISPFDLNVPTLENITEQFGDKFRSIISNIGGELIRIDGSETPTRSYGIDFSNDSEFITRIGKQSAESINSIIEKLIKGTTDENR